MEHTASIGAGAPAAHAPAHASAASAPHGVQAAAGYATQAGLDLAGRIDEIV
jgi:hypothetical protein